MELEDFAFLTLATKEDANLQSNLTYNYKKKLKVRICAIAKTGHPTEVHISTILVANNLPPQESKLVIVKTIEKIFGEDNVVGVSFGQPRWCYIQCFNVVVYTQWLNKFAYILGSKFDFIPRKGKINGS